ncbi:hypothetical protein F3F96_03730 [Mariprofundus sp. NF]|uniref:hypothetical protein n=1 Tax=Mariprofundus sp. NF TaxID=2608716 RepID=UPI0015A161CC|nr:hypothetical protein [Mariprofundus sp. NF]NWF38246.1 hypothetical protein [Mariprofundus sp. NF]
MKKIIFIPMFLALTTQANAEFANGEHNVNDCVVTKTTLVCSTGNADVRKITVTLKRSDISLVRTETKFKVKTEAVINPGNNQQMIYVKGSAAEVDAFVKKLF